MNTTFIKGFEKTALMPTRGEEDLVVAGTSMVPFGSTLHMLLGDRRGLGATEWLARLVGAIAGSSVGVIPGTLLKNPALASVGALAGMAAGEVTANRLVHSKAYKKGFLKKASPVLVEQTYDGSLSEHQAQRQTILERSERKNVVNPNKKVTREEGIPKPDTKPVAYMEKGY